MSNLSMSISRPKAAFLLGARKASNLVDPAKIKKLYESLGATKGEISLVSLNEEEWTANLIEFGDIEKPKPIKRKKKAPLPGGVTYPVQPSGAELEEGETYDPDEEDSEDEEE